MTTFYRIMLGGRSKHAEECFTAGFVGTDYGIHEDLSGKLPDEWRAFNKRYIPVFLSTHPDKSRVAAGLACGAVWTVAKGLRGGDKVLSPDGQDGYRLGEVVGDYQYASGQPLPHRRPVRWLPERIERSEMSDALKRSTRSMNTVIDVSGHRDEIERLFGTRSAPSIISTDPEIEDPAAFALEKHLEDFLVENWAKTDFGKTHDIFEEDGDKIGQQYQTDTGPIDIFAISKDKRELLVVELKKGRASDAVVGQTLRYMGYVLQELAEGGQTVRGVIIALEDDQKLRRALAASPSISFYRYEVSFKLVRA